MSLYCIEIHRPHPVNGETLLADISPDITDRSFVISRNKAEAIDLKLDLRQAELRADKARMSFDSLFAEGANELRIFRGNRPLIGGTINYVDPVLDDSGESLEIKATGFLDLLKDRVLFPVAGVDGGKTIYTSQDIGAVMWDMIATSQADFYLPNGELITNGDFGIRQGVIQTSRLLSDSWAPFATNLRDILIAITGRLDSVDFSFTYDKKFNVFYPGIGSDKSRELLFTYPGNIKKLEYPKDATSLVNVAIERGQGNGLDQQVIQVRQNLDSQGQYARRDGVFDQPDVNVVDTLNDYGDEEVRVAGTSARIPDVVVDGRMEPQLGPDKQRSGCYESAAVRLVG